MESNLFFFVPKGIWIGKTRSQDENGEDLSLINCDKHIYHKPKLINDWDLDITKNKLLYIERACFSFFL